MSRRTTPRHRAAPPPTTSAKPFIRRIPVLAGAAVFVAVVASVAAITLSGGPHSSDGSQSTVQELLGRAESQSAANALSSESADGSGHGVGGSAPGRAVGLGPTGSSTTSATPAKPGTPGASTPATSGGIAAESTSAPAANSATAPANVAAPAVKPAGPPTINISSNITFSVDSSCRSAPTGAACTNAAIASLNHARAVLGIAAYNIPANFVSMTPQQQLLVLSNLDRAVFGLQQLAGLNSTLNSAAQQGVTNGGDPIGVDVGSVQWQSWGSNWASGYPNAAYTYDAWMYDDGLGSSNGDCTSSNSAGCWGHRLNTLHNFGSNVQIGMGVGASGTTFTELYESFAASASVSYLPAP